MPDLVRITVDGHAVEVAPRTSVAVAVLVARGATRTSVGGERRAPLCGMGSCHECRVTLDGRLHVRSCTVECRAGMEVKTGA